MKICYKFKISLGKSITLATACLLLLGQVELVGQGNMGVGTNLPDPSAMLDVTSTTMGLLIPRMTQVQRNAIASPATSLVVYNTTTNQFNYYDGTAWQVFVSGVTPWLISGNSTPDAWNGTAGSYLGTSSPHPLVIATTDGSAQNMQFWTNNLERARITGDGKLAVGLTNPVGYVDIKQPNTADLGDAPTLNVIRDNNGAVISSTYPVVRIIQDNTADQNASLYVRQDGVPSSPIELPAVYGLAAANTAEQVIGVWGDATLGQGSIGVLATGNGANNVALQVNDGDFAMGRSSVNPSPGTATDLATAGTDYSDNGPSGVFELTLGSAGDLVTAAPTAGAFQDLGTVTVNNSFVKNTSVILINVVNKSNAGAGPSPLNSLFMIDVETRANGSFSIHIGMIPNETSAQNYDSDRIRIGYVVVNPSK